MPPRTTTWLLEPHTRGKHLVLDRYMQTWLPIMTKWNGRVLFVDAFAGPGEYSGGELGSPVIALRALIEHRAKNQMRSEINYLFIEKDVDRCEHLTQVLCSLDAELPANCSYEALNSTFDETLTDVLDNIDQQNTSLAPAFVMIDPFGVSGTPMKIIGRIFENPKSEVYISFMYRDINRFREHPNFERHLDELFGCPEWRQGMDLADGEERKSFFYGLCGRQLKRNGAQYVLRFELYEGEQLVYAIFFGTKSLDGCDKMKQAIWTVAPFGDFMFRGSQLGHCVPDERFWTEKGLVDGRCPDCGRAVERISEDNYFFRMSKYQDWLLDYLKDHPKLISRHTVEARYLDTSGGLLAIGASQGRSSGWTGVSGCRSMRTTLPTSGSTPSSTT